MSILSFASLALLAETATAAPALRGRRTAEGPELCKGVPEAIKVHLPGCGGHEDMPPQTSWCQQMPAELRVHFDFCKDADAAEAKTTAAPAATAAAQGPQLCKGIPEEIKVHLPGCGGHEDMPPQTSWCQQMPAELRVHFDFCKDADAAEATTTAAAATAAAAQGPQWPWSWPR
eukprot:TRINITY_DN1153_c0_g1_i10.p2 TRINITY_DN1153_c0_g1~~TRINITY_DN1153_c0_g1_i10.p2  ORF type:complete len:174 (+),score=43.30 TRINITY_DN1153_c0_g1_i10:63-584(+)